MGLGMAIGLLYNDDPITQINPSLQNQHKIHKERGLQLSLLRPENCDTAEIL